MDNALRVLNVEDSERDVELLKRHLTRGGYELVLARVETADAMRAALLSQEWDVILCDYSMPQFDALRALAVLKETGLDIPFIIISGTVGEESAVEAMRGGANDYLMKDNLLRLCLTIERERHEAHNRKARRKVEAELRESEDRYRDLVEHSHDLICTHDLEGRILSVNRAAATILGYEPENMLGRNIREALLPKARDGFEAYIETLLRDHIAHGVMVVQAKSGERRVWEYTNTLRTEGVTTPIVRGVAHDVTEQRQAERALKASEAELRALFVAMTDTILVLDAEGRHLKIAPTDPAYSYAPSEALIGKKLDEVFSEKEAAFFLEHIRRALSEKEMHRVEYDLKIGESKMWFDGSVSPLTQDSVVWIARDITQRKRIEEERRLIVEIIQGVNTTPNLDELLKLIHASIGRLLYAENCFVALHDQDTDLINFEFWADKYDPVPSPRAVGNGLISYVLRAGEPVLLTKELEERYRSGIERTTGRPAASWLGVPLRRPPETIGVLVLKHYDDAFAYTQRDLELLSSVGDQIAVAIDRKRAEEKLRESEEGYRVVAETATDVIVTIDQDSKILFANQAIERVFGYPLSELIDNNITFLMPEYLRHIHRSSLDRYVETGRKHINWESIELTALHKSGREIPIELSFGEFQKNGRRFFTGIARDITERRRAERDLSKSEERYRDLVENAHDIIYSHDLEGNYTSINKAGEHITGYSREEALTMNLTQIVAPEYVETARGMIAEKLAGKESTAYDLEIMAKDGRRIAIEVNSKLVIQEGAGSVIQGIARDVTERKHLEEQLRQSQKMEAIGLLAGGVAHDFNNLLTAITGYSELTIRRLPNQSPLRPYLEEIKKAGDRAASLTRQLLAFSRKQVLQPRVLDLNAVVSDLQKMLRRLIGEHIELRTVLEPNIDGIKVDPGQIEQIIMNLSVNARDAMPQGGTLTIETRTVHLDNSYAKTHISVSPGHYVMLAVTDTGTGMDAQTQARIFEPFYTTKEVGRGTGLGLSTVYGIVKQSGGNIWVYSEVGLGTTFKIYLPRTSEGVQQYRRTSESEESRRGTETILLAEDDAIVRSLAITVLRLFGYNVLEAKDGDDAIEICEAHSEPIHLLITDVIMPKRSGRVLANRLAELRPEIKILYMSGYTDDAIVHQGVLDEGANFIQKPFSTDDFVAKVREVLDAKDATSA